MTITPKIKTPLSHAAITVALGLIGWVLGSLVIGLMFALGFYFGREVAQQEAKTEGSPWRGLEVWKWNLDAQLDMGFPIIAAVLLSVIAWFF